MLFHLTEANIFACELIVALLQCQGMVPDQTCNIDLLMEALIPPFVGVEAILICFPDFGWLF